MRIHKALRNAFRTLQLSTADDPKAAVGILATALLDEVTQGWHELEHDNGGRIAFAYRNPLYAHLPTAGFQVQIAREEPEWILGSVATVAENPIGGGWTD